MPAVGLVVGLGVEVGAGVELVLEELVDSGGGGGGGGADLSNLFRRLRVQSVCYLATSRIEESSLIDYMNHTICNNPIS